MNTEGTGFYTCKECNTTESLSKHTTIIHKEREQLGDRRNDGESSYNSGDGTAQMAQPLMFMMMMIYFVRSVVVRTALLVERSRDRFPVMSLGIFSVVPPTEPCALRSTQPLKVSATDFSWGKGGRCIWLTTYHPCSAKTSRKSGALTFWSRNFTFKF